MIKAWTDRAWDGLEHWLTDRKKLQRIWMLMKSIERDGAKGYGKPEPLHGDLSGFWSRRIDEKNRIVYKIEENMILITECGTHYQDK